MSFFRSVLLGASQATSAGVALEEQRDDRLAYIAGRPTVDPTSVSLVPGRHQTGFGWRSCAARILLALRELDQPVAVAANEHRLKNGLLQPRRFALIGSGARCSRGDASWRIASPRARIGFRLAAAKSRSRSLAVMKLRRIIRDRRR